MIDENECERLRKLRSNRECDDHVALSFTFQTSRNVVFYVIRNYVECSYASGWMGFSCTKKYSNFFFLEQKSIAPKKDKWLAPSFQRSRVVNYDKKKLCEIRKDKIRNDLYQCK